MSEWKKYEGTDEQIAEMLNAEHGFIIRSRGIEYHVMHNIDERGLLVDCDEYLICNRHKYAKLIQRWARTGQPVYWISKRRPYIFGHCSISEDGGGIDHPPFILPETCEYSFTPFEEEK